MAQGHVALDSPPMAVCGQPLLLRHPGRTGHSPCWKTEEQNEVALQLCGDVVSLFPFRGLCSLGPFSNLNYSGNSTFGFSPDKL